MGGGAGKRLLMNGVYVEIVCSISKDGIVYQRKDINLPDKFNLTGYDDGATDILTEGMFEADIEDFSKEIMEAEFYDKKILSLYSNSEKFLDTEFKNFKEFFQKNPDVTIDLVLNGDCEFDEMKGAGFTTYSWDKKETFTECEWDEVSLGFDGGEEIEFVEDTYNIIPTPVLETTERFYDLVQDLFNFDLEKWKENMETDDTDEVISDEQAFEDYRDYIDTSYRNNH